MNTRFGEVLTAMVTPFNSDGSLNLQGAKDTAAYLVDHGSDGLVVCGTTGESPTLSHDEKIALFTGVVETVGSRAKVIAGTGTYDTADTIELTRIAQETGCHGALVVTPYYNRPPQRGLIAHFTKVAESTDLPIILYNIPGRSAVNLNPDTIARLARDCPNIIGVKEANTNFNQVSEVIARCGRGFYVYSGIETLCYPMLCLGGAGHVSATGNVLPRQVAELFNLTEAGRWLEARDLHYELLEMNEILFVETNPGPAKTALGLMGKISPELRLPLAPMYPTNEARLRQVMIKYGLLPAGALHESDLAAVGVED